MASKELNILHIDSEKYWRGGQQQVYYLHKGLINRNINSLVICNKDSELKKKCQMTNLPFTEIYMLGEIDVIAAFRISRICSKNKIRIIHAHSAHALSIGLLAKLFYRPVILIGVRRVDFPISKNYLSRKKYMSNHLDRIICVSDFIKNVLIEDNLEEKKLITIRSGIDVNKFDDIFINETFRNELGVEKDEILIGTVAAFAGHKDYPNLLRAFQQIKKRKKNVKLCMVGEGPLKIEISGLIKKLGIEDSVIMPGFRKDVGKFLKSFDIFVLASKKEGLGTSIIDAFSIGLPVVATKAGGIPELVRDGYNGRLVDPQNSSQLANAIIELIEDEGKRVELAKNAIVSAKDFSIENTIEQNIGEYKKLLGLSNYG